MHRSELNPNPDLSVPPIPVICDKCRDTGMAGDQAFSAIPDIINFTPVPRRAHANNWTAEHQRAFIAALAITGSPRQAARAIGRHAFGAEQLKSHRHGKSFAAAWDAAMELAREREVHRIHANLMELAKSSPERGGGPSRTGSGTVEGAQPIHPDCDYDPEIHTDDYPEYWDAQHRIRDRLLRARRLLLFLIAGDEDKRRAWEVLVGPADWDKARQLEPQDDEPQPVRGTGEGSSEPDGGEFMNPHGLPNMTRPDMLLTAEAGLLPEMTGGEDALEEIRRAVADAKETDAQASRDLSRETTPSGQRGAPDSIRGEPD